MESFNVYKAYDQLNATTDDDNNRINLLHDRPRRRTLIIATTSVLLLTIFLGALICSLFFDSSTDVLEPEDSIRYVCSVTQHRDACFSDISSIDRRPRPDPDFIFSLSLRAALNEVSRLGSLPKDLISKVNDPRTVSALTDCDELLNDAVELMNRSTAAVAENKALTELTIGDLRTWISAAMTDQDTCVDGLGEVGSTTVADEVKGKVQRATVCMSNSLAILAEMKTIVKKFEQHQKQMHG